MLYGAGCVVRGVRDTPKMSAPTVATAIIVKTLRLCTTMSLHVLLDCIIIHREAKKLNSYLA